MSTLRLASRISVLGSLVAFGIACGGSSISVGSDQSAQKAGDGGAGGSSDASTPPAKGAACVQDSDCGPAGSGNICGFEEKLACAATGTCFDIGQVATCAAYSPGCACDGTEINVACSPLPQGYASKPLLHAGACSKTGGGDSCTSSSDCGPGAICGFPEADQCAAKGTCFPLTGGAMCNAYGAGCACDGTEINIICNGLSAGYQTKPLAHKGACNDAGP